MFSSLPNHLIMRIIKESTQETRDLNSWKKKIATINQVFIEKRNELVQDWEEEDYDGVLADHHRSNMCPSYFGLYFAGTEKCWEDVFLVEDLVERWDVLEPLDIRLSLRRCLNFILY